MLLFAEVEHALKKIGPQFGGSVLHQMDSLKPFSDIEEMLKQESQDFEVSLLALLTYMHEELNLKVLHIWPFSVM